MLTGAYLTDTLGGIGALELLAGGANASLPGVGAGVFAPAPCVYAPPPRAAELVLCALPEGAFAPNMSVRLRLRGLLTAWAEKLLAPAAPALGAVAAVGASGWSDGGGGLTRTAPALAPPPAGAQLDAAGGALVSVRGWGLHPLERLTATLGGAPLPLLAVAPGAPFPLGAFRDGLVGRLDAATWATAPAGVLAGVVAALLAPAFSAHAAANPDEVLFLSPPSAARSPLLFIATYNSTANASVVLPYAPRASPLVAPWALAFSTAGGGAGWPPEGDAVRGGGGGGAITGNGFGEEGGAVVFGAPALPAGATFATCPTTWAATTLSARSDGAGDGASRELAGPRLAALAAPGARAPASCGNVSVIARVALRRGGAAAAAAGALGLPNCSTAGWPFPRACAGAPEAAHDVLCLSAPGAAGGGDPLGALLAGGAVGGGLYVEGVAAAGAVAGGGAAPRAWREAAPPGLPCVVTFWGFAPAAAPGGASVVSFSRPPWAGAAALRLLRGANASLLSAEALPVSYAPPSWGAPVPGVPLAPLAPLRGSGGGEPLTLSGANFGLAASLCGTWVASGASANPLPGFPLGPCANGSTAPEDTAPAALPHGVFFLPSAPDAPPAPCRVTAWGPRTIACVAPGGTPGTTATPALALFGALPGAGLASPVAYTYEPAALRALEVEGNVSGTRVSAGGFFLTLRGAGLFPPAPSWAVGVAVACADRDGATVGRFQGSAAPALLLNVTVRGGAATVLLPPAAPPAPYAVEGTLAFSMLYFPAVGGPGSPLAVRVGPPQAFIAPPPEGLRVLDLTVTADPCAGGVAPPVRSSPTLPCLRVSGLSPASPLTLTFLGENLGAVVGGDGASVITLFSEGGVSARCGGAVLVGGALTCTVTTPLNRGALNITMGGFAVGTVRALGACAPGWWAPANGVPCAPCPAEGARCAGGFDAAIAAPGWWQTTSEEWGALGFPGGAPPEALPFQPCPRPELCLAANACVNGSAGWACTACAPGAALGATGGACASCADAAAGNAAFAVGVALAVVGVLALGAGFVAVEGGACGACARGGGKGGAPPPLTSAPQHAEEPRPVGLLPLARIAASLAHTLAVLATFAPAVERVAAGGAATLWRADLFFAAVASFRAVKDLGSSSAAVACLLAPSPGLRAWAVVIAPAAGAGFAWAAAGLVEVVARCRGGSGGGARGGGAAAKGPLSSFPSHASAAAESPFTACLTSRAGSAATYASLLLASFFVPGTLLFAGVALRCAPAGAGGYQLEDPSLPCRDARFAPYAGGVAAAWAYLAVPLGALLAACGARPGAPPRALAAFTEGYARTHAGTAWEAGTLLRKAATAATAAGLLGAASPPSALLGVLAWLLVGLFLQLCARPFAAPVLNLLEGLGILAGAAATLALLPRTQPSVAAPLPGLDAAAAALLATFAAAWALVAGDALLARGGGLAAATACATRWRGAPPPAPHAHHAAPPAGGGEFLVLRGLEDGTPVRAMENPLFLGGAAAAAAGGGGEGPAAAAASGAATPHAGLQQLLSDEWRPVLGLPPLFSGGGVTGRAASPAASRIVRNTRVVELPPTAEGAASMSTFSPLAVARSAGAFATSARTERPQQQELSPAPPAPPALQPPQQQSATAESEDPWSHG